jgi:hypothetical protein
MRVSLISTIMDAWFWFQGDHWGVLVRGENDKVRFWKDVRFF